MLFIIFHYSFYWISAIFSFVAMATKEKLSFATKTTMSASQPAGHSRKFPLTLNNFNLSGNYNSIFV
jgi:hypothetical protein